MLKSIRQRSLCSKMIGYLFSIITLGCSTILMNLNKCPSEHKFPNRKIRLPIWMCPLLKILPIQINFIYNLLWKIKKISPLMLNGAFSYKTKHLLKTGLELYKHSKIKKYNKWWILRKKKNNNPAKLTTKVLFKMKKLTMHGFMILLVMDWWKYRTSLRQSQNQNQNPK